MNYHYYSSTENIPLPQNKKIVLVGGCFDILHFGHIQFLQKSREAGDYLVVAIEPDERIINHKNRQPIHTQQERAQNLSALRFVDFVILLPVLSGFEDYLLLVKKCKPAIISIISNDEHIDNKRKQAEAVGAQLVIATDMIGNFSSSNILHIW